MSSAQESDSNLNASFGLVTSNSDTLKCKLPWLEIPVFDGDPLEWQDFWDQYNVSFHCNDRISDVDKFIYLKSLLSGKALALAKGFVLSADNYKEAVDLLKEEFGNTQVLISAHLDAPIKIKKVKGNEYFEGMRKCITKLKHV